MARVNMTFAELGKLLDPPLGRRAVWYLVENASTLSRIEAIAKALDLAPKDLIL